MQVFVFVFSGLTGYFGQGNVLDQAYGDALVMELQHYFGRRSNRVTSLSTERIRGVFDFILLLYAFTSCYLNIGDNVHLKCKGG